MLAFTYLISKGTVLVYVQLTLHNLQKLTDTLWLSNLDDYFVSSDNLDDYLVSSDNLEDYLVSSDNLEDYLVSSDNCKLLI